MLGPWTFLVNRQDSDLLDFGDTEDQQRFHPKPRAASRFQCGSQRTCFRWRISGRQTLENRAGHGARRCWSRSCAELSEERNCGRPRICHSSHRSWWEYPRCGFDGDASWTRTRYSDVHGKRVFISGRSLVVADRSSSLWLTMNRGNASNNIRFSDTTSAGHGEVSRVECQQQWWRLLLVVEFCLLYEYLR